MNIDPRGLTVREWADFTVPLLDPWGGVGKLENDRDWQVWAASILNLPRMSTFSPPDPYQFKDWREWVFRFNQAVDLRG